MEQTPVAIVGAGPAGLTLALTLAKHEVHSIILEKETDITKDPRGVYLTYDSIRILRHLGLDDQLKIIGHEVSNVNFHRSNWTNKPFYNMDTSADVAQQALPNGLLQIQPELERALRDLVESNTFCEIRKGCTVHSYERINNLLAVKYAESTNSSQELQCSWLIGADGKRGVVRKHFLEQTAGIRQVDSAYRYEGTWVAANLHITPPTPSSHPDFPLWKLGYTPQEVYDIFWPEGWHFVSPPGKATAAGRFGPYEACLWRHEFEQRDWNDSMNAEELLWEHITPMITRDTDTDGKRWYVGSVTFPRECIEILRCRPFKFAHKVVNKWYSGNMVLVGDAAHVFPPFGGQGIASGLRDAHQLGWRLAILCKKGFAGDGLADQLLSAWSLERTQSVADAAVLTRINGQLCNGEEDLRTTLLRWFMTIITKIPLLSTISPVNNTELTGFKKVIGGCFSTAHSGGDRLAQVWLVRPGETPVMSDSLLLGKSTVLTLLIIGEENQLTQHELDGMTTLSEADIPPAFLNAKSICSISTTKLCESTPRREDDIIRYAVCPVEQVPAGKMVRGYNANAFLQRLGSGARYVVARPDFYVYGVAKDIAGLQSCLQMLKEHLLGDPGSQKKLSSAL